jgi:hypothetical protein
MFTKQKSENFIKFIPKYCFVLCMGVAMGKEKLPQTSFLIYSKQLQ